MLRKMVSLIKKYWMYIAGGIVGAIGGYLYWYYVGCSGGTCPITASPTMSVIWGTLSGALLFSIVFARKTKPKAELKELLNNGALVVDVRTKSEYAGGHVKNSKNIPLDELGKSLHTLDKEQNIVVVCASGMRSSQAVSLMKKNGFTNCYNGGSWLNFK
jgi:rhodanese-related sulfurtransferase